MSDTLAIAAVTATLSKLIEDGLNADPKLAGARVTTMPPDRARNGTNTNQLNLFLYNTGIDAALRNMDPPHQVRPGETGNPPLALTLDYLLIAYGQDNQDVMSHRMLGSAMSTLHDHPLLFAAEIKAALPDSDLAEQVERVRITPRALSVEEISKLWTAFQTQYRISVAYEVSVVLIDSKRPSITPLPVLTRGIFVHADLFSSLKNLSLPKGRPSALPGDTLKLTGFGLSGAQTARFSSRRLDQQIPDHPTLAGGSDTRATVQIPNGPAGPWTVALVIKRTGEPDQITNELAFGLAPQITSTLPLNAARDANGDATVNLTVSPDVLPEQRVFLLLSPKVRPERRVGDRQIAAQPLPAPGPNLSFVINAAVAGDYLVRLRVDGVDSLLVQDFEKPPPVFDDNQMVTIT